MYQSMYEGLLLIASRAIAESRVPSEERQPTAAEIEPLLVDLRNVIRNALNTYFRTTEKVFARGRVDDVLSERVVNEVVAEYFDKRLRYLLEHNRPQVRDFVRNNMPAVYRLRVPADWAKRKQQWEKSLEDGGYADVVKVLRGMGDLIDPDEVGKVPGGVRDEVSRAAALKDHKRVSELLTPSATELRTFLFSEAQRLLQYRQPSQPQLQDNRARETFRRAQDLSRSSDSRTLNRALVEMQKVWEAVVESLVDKRRREVSGALLSAYKSEAPLWALLRLTTLTDLADDENSDEDPVGRVLRDAAWEDTESYSWVSEGCPVRRTSWEY
jgi:hypothetical protein